MVTQKQEKKDSTTEQSKFPTQQTDNTIIRTPSPLMRQKRINTSSTNLTHTQGGGVGSPDSIDVVDGDEAIDERKKNKREGEDEVTKLVNKPLATRCVCVSCICVCVFV